MATSLENMKSLISMDFLLSSKSMSMLDAEKFISLFNTNLFVKSKTLFDQNVRCVYSSV